MAEFPKAFAAAWPHVNPLLPEIYRYWLQVYNLKGSYDAVPIDANALPRFLENMGQRGYSGGTISQPHKEAAFALTAKTSARAKRLRAVNFVWLEGGALCGDNSDAQAFAANLDAMLPGWAPSGGKAGGGQAVVLGAGYAARAVLEALASRGFRAAFVAARAEDQALKLAEDFSPSAAIKVKGGGADAVNAYLPKTRLIVNTGAFGAAAAPPPPPPLAAAPAFAPQAESAAAAAQAPQQAGLPAAAGFDFIDFQRLPEGAAAADIVYAPQNTVFLRLAAAAGLQTANGLGMLLQQAAPGFARWFGQKPRIDADLRRFIAAKIPA